MMSINIGVLALQGGFSEHVSHLKEAARLNFSIVNIQIHQVRTGNDLECLDGLVIPGGESTSIRILLKEKNSNLCNGLKDFIKRKPVFGTCAGMILLANEIDNDEVSPGTQNLIMNNNS